MGRPLRIELADAWYHVSNRGAGRQRIFRNDQHRTMLLALIGELRDRHGVETHAYCFMSNRYDLVLRTTEANLSVAMRHLDGVYTQRYNRSIDRDGPLFRGRYRAVLFDAESCLVAVSRHVHRRPLVSGTVPRLDRYRWSSYPSYVTRRVRPSWLVRDTLLTHYADEDRPARAYRRYIEREGMGNDLVRSYYRSRRPGPILGPPDFHRQMLSRAEALSGGAAWERRPPGPDAEDVLAAVARHYEVDRSEILASRRGRLNLPRLAAVWLCRYRSHLTLQDTAELFGMRSFGSASSVLHRVKTQMRPAFWRRIREIEADLQADR
ncbi:MAG: transposase [Pseudomonadota bacterium]